MFAHVIVNAVNGRRPWDPPKYYVESPTVMKICGIDIFGASMIYWQLKAVKFNEPKTGT